MINSKLIKDILSLDTELNNECRQLDLANTQMPGTLSFIDDSKFIDQLNENNNIVAVFVTEELSDKINKSADKIICEDPRYEFYALFNHLARINHKRNPNKIHPSAKIHPKAFIGEHNVSIGANSVIEANCSILDDVEIGENCIIRHGAVLGCEGYEYKRTKKGILPVYHDRRVILHNRVEIGSNTVVDKGFMQRDTVIGDDTKIDNLIHIAHRAHIGKRCLIVAHALIGGYVTMGDDVWVGPNATISNGLTIGDKATVSLGAIVTRNVEAGKRVSGNFAIDHDKFLAFVKSIR